MAGSSAAASSIISRAKAIILTPATEWPKIAGEDTTTREILTSYVLPLAVIGPVAGFIGGQVFGYGAFGYAYRPSVISAALGGFVALVLGVISFLLLTIIADLLSPRFGGRVDTRNAFRLVAYGATPVWLVGIFTLVPILGILGLLAFYSIYLTYLGVTPMLGVPKEKALGFTAVFVLCGFVLNLIVAALSSANMQMLSSMGLLS